MNQNDSPSPDGAATQVQNSSYYSVGIVTLGTLTVHLVHPHSSTSPTPGATSLTLPPPSQTLPSPLGRDLITVTPVISSPQNFSHPPRQDVATATPATSYPPPPSPVSRQEAINKLGSSSPPNSEKRKRRNGERKKAYLARHNLRGDGMGGRGNGTGGDGGRGYS